MTLSGSSTELKEVYICRRARGVRQSDALWVHGVVGGRVAAALDGGGGRRRGRRACGGAAQRVPGGGRRVDAAGGAGGGRGGVPRERAVERRARSPPTSVHSSAVRLLLDRAPSLC